MRTSNSHVDKGHNADGCSSVPQAELARCHVLRDCNGPAGVYAPQQSLHMQNQEVQSPMSGGRVKYGSGRRGFVIAMVRIDHDLGHRKLAMAMAEVESGSVRRELAMAMAAVKYGLERCGFAIDMVRTDNSLGRRELAMAMAGVESDSVRCRVVIAIVSQGHPLLELC